MKVNEIMARQNRVVYTLLVVCGALGLAWALWQHLHASARPAVARLVSGAAPAVWRGRRSQ